MEDLAQLKRQNEQLVAVLMSVRKELSGLVRNPRGPKHIAVGYLRGMLNICEYVLKPYERRAKDAIPQKGSGNGI